MNQVTDGPYNESIRGPGQGGIRGLWTLLNAIAGGIGSLPQIAADIALIRAQLSGTGTTLRERISYLTGTTQVAVNQWDANGLPGYLTYVWASKSQRNNSGANFWELLNLNTDQLALLFQALFTLETTQGATGQLPLLRAEIAKLVESVGVRGASTTNLSALAYLALIANSTERSADCCEDAAANPPLPPAPPTNVQPADFCSLFPENAVRNSGYVLLTDGQFANSPQTAYGLLWPAFEQVTTITQAAGGAPNPGWNGLRSSNAYDYCLAWNFTNDNVPGQARTHRTEEAWSTVSSQGSNTVINLSVQGANATSTGPQSYFNYVIILEAGQTLPGNNFFLRHALPGGGT